MSVGPLDIQMPVDHFVRWCWYISLDVIVCWSSGSMIVRPLGSCKLVWLVLVGWSCRWIFGWW